MTEHHGFTLMSRQEQGAAEQDLACDEAQEGRSRSVTIIFPVANHRWHLDVRD